jgi:hypothetical protein
MIHSATARHRAPDGHHQTQRPYRSGAPLMQDSNATVVRDAAAAGVPVLPAQEQQE